MLSSIILSEKEKATTQERHHRQILQGWFVGAYCALLLFVPTDAIAYPSHVLSDSKTSTKQRGVKSSSAWGEREQERFRRIQAEDDNSNDTTEDDVSELADTTTTTTTTTTTAASSSNNNAAGDTSIVEIDYKTFVMGAKDSPYKTLASVCESDRPDDFSGAPLVEQRITFQYSMFVPPSVNPLTKIQQLENRIHQGLSKMILGCEDHNTVATKLFYINTLVTFPPDELLGECTRQQANGSNDTDEDEDGGDSSSNNGGGGSATTICYDVRGYLTAEIAYPGDGNGDGGTRRLRPPLSFARKRDNDDSRNHYKNNKNSHIRKLQSDSDVPTEYIDAFSDTIPSQYMEIFQESPISTILEDPELRQFLTSTVVETLLSGGSITDVLSDPEVIGTIGGYFIDYLENSSILEDSDIASVLFKGFLTGDGSMINIGSLTGNNGETYVTPVTPTPRAFNSEENEANFAAATKQADQNSNRNTDIMTIVPYVAIGVSVVVLATAFFLIARKKSKQRLGEQEQIVPGRMGRKERRSRKKGGSASIANRSIDEIPVLDRTLEETMTIGSKPDQPDPYFDPYESGYGSSNDHNSQVLSDLRDLENSLSKITSYDTSYDVSPISPRTRSTSSSVQQSDGRERSPGISHDGASTHYLRTLGMTSADEEKSDALNNHQIISPIRQTRSTRSLHYENSIMHGGTNAGHGAIVAGSPPRMYVRSLNGAARQPPSSPDTVKL